jgi:NTP pyrophosphatase (non-canonical NTP hydrolase)
MDSISEITTRINAFRDARDWKQFHNPKDMAVSISIEAAELLEQFQWKNRAECDAHLKTNREAVADEMADVAIYLFELADLLQMDLGKEMLRKLGKNADKYPVDKAKGSNKKYDELNQ